MQGTNEAGEKIATCPYCNITLVAKGNSGTSHLKRHLERCLQRPVGLEIGGESVNDDETFRFDMSQLRKAIVLFITEGGHSFSVVEQKGFKRMMSKATPHFVPFSRYTATRELMLLYVLDRERVKHMLAKSPGRICFTTDCWSSSHSWQHYICITAHFVDSHWKLQKRILRFRALNPPYDGESIANEIFQFLVQWSLERKVLTFTVDNATYNDTMLCKLRGRLYEKGPLVGDGAFLHIRCCTHIVNLIVKAGLDCIKSILDKIRTLMRLIHKSAKRSKEFYETAQKNFHLDVKRKLSLDMEVRWNSTYKMLDNVFYYKDVFVQLRSTNYSFMSLVPSESEWNKLSVIHKFLKVFYDVTCMFSSVNNPTSNLYFRGACMIHLRLLEASTSSHDFLREMVNPMYDKFDKYWEEYNIYLSCATILDPRFKVKFVEYSFTKLYGIEEAGRKVDRVLDTLNKLFNEYKESSGSLIVSPPPPSFTDDNMFGDYHSFTGRNARSRTRRSQLDLYLEEEGLGMDSELNVLEYWHQCAIRYPILSILARDLLTIPVSTVASESAFSIGGKTISPSRSSLKPKTVQALVCVQDWRRAEGDIWSDSEVDITEDDEACDDIGDDIDETSLFL